MERDYDWSSTVHLADLTPVAIGAGAAELAGAAAEPDPAEDGAHPGGVRPARGHRRGDRARERLGGARGTSFLKDRMSEQVLAKGLVVRDDPSRRRGLRSRPFDGEGMPGRPRHRR